MSDLLYIEARLQAIKEIACSIIEYNDAENVMSFCDEIRCAIGEETVKEPEECEWKLCGDSLGIKWYETCDEITTRKPRFRYCPYCGRKIKEVE